MADEHSDDHSDGAKKKRGDSAVSSGKDDLKFDEYLRASAVRAPVARELDSATEWSRIEARIHSQNGESSVFSTLLGLIRSFDFWVPVISFAVIAVVVTTVLPSNIPTNLPAWMGGDVTAASLNQVSEFFSTDLNPKTVTAETAFLNY